MKNDSAIGREREEAMGYVKRGTTPTHIFEVDLDLRDAEDLKIVYEQYGRIIFSKDLKDCVVEETKVTTDLTQEETLMLKPETQTSVEIIAEFPRGKVVRSNIMQVCVKPTLYEEEF